MTVFAEKLSNLAVTVRLGIQAPIDAVAESLRKGAGRSAIAVGSGGSAVAAAYFARCRSTLGLGATIVQTPMDFVLGLDQLSGTDIWLFSAGADNPDVAAALTAALGSAAAHVHLLTVNPEGATALAAAAREDVQLFVAPVAERKDGFLATHSLMAMITCLAAAADQVAGPGGAAALVERLAAEVERVGQGAQAETPDFRPGDTVFVLFDPQCRPLASLVETSLWETAIAPVQLADFRNFAHGRHVWAARRPEEMFVIALTTAASRDIWYAIRDALPSVRMAEIDLGHAGRFRSAVSVAEGLELVRILGVIADIDPGKPGRGAFAGAIYGDPGLVELARKLNPAIRHKLEAVQLHDDPACPPTAATAVHDQWIGTMSGARIGAILLDYDGTVVATEARLAPPADALIAEITRLADAGLVIGFATGRGGSAGEALRDALPQRLHAKVTIGYYNGGHIRPLDIDIDQDPPAANPDLAALADWIEGQDLLLPGVVLKRGSVQLSIKHVEIAALASFAAEITCFPAIADGRIKALRSHHSFDLLPVGTSKSTVTERMRNHIGDSAEVLAIGDTGEPGGNDTEMLAQSPSVSVDSVCGHLDGSWSFFGRSASGPAALLRILRALRVENGHARLDFDSLGASTV